jgi:hypothetical protein
MMFGQDQGGRSGITRVILKQQQWAAVNELEVVGCFGVEYSRLVGKDHRRSSTAMSKRQCSARISYFVAVIRLMMIVVDRCGSGSLLVWVWFGKVEAKTGRRFSGAGL